MSAFGKKPGVSNGRPSFGVARPMTGGSGSGSHSGSSSGHSNIPEPMPAGGEQFPPLNAVDLPGGSSAPVDRQDAMSRLTERASAVAEVDDGPQGFEASVHKIKEQVLPRLLERVDPEAAASLNKEELTEEFRPIILEVLAELKTDTQPA